MTRSRVEFYTTPEGFASVRYPSKDGLRTLPLLDRHGEPVNLTREVQGRPIMEVKDKVDRITAMLSSP